MEVNSAPKQSGYKLSSKYCPLCSAEQRHSYRFGTTCRWVTDDRMFIFGSTITLMHTNLVKMHQTVCLLKCLASPLSLSRSITVTEGLSKHVSVYVMKLEALFDPLKSYWILHVSIWASLLQMAISANVSMWKFYCVALSLNVKSSSKAWQCQVDIF